MQLVDVLFFSLNYKSLFNILELVEQKSDVLFMTTLIRGGIEVYSHSIPLIYSHLENISLIRLEISVFRKETSF